MLATAVIFHTTILLVSNTVFLFASTDELHEGPRYTGLRRARRQSHENSRCGSLSGRARARNDYRDSHTCTALSATSGTQTGSARGTRRGHRSGQAEIPEEPADHGNLSESSDCADRTLTGNAFSRCLRRSTREWRARQPLSPRQAPAARSPAAAARPARQRRQAPSASSVRAARRLRQARAL
jgi:hypothetical protein